MSITMNQATAPHHQKGDPGWPSKTPNPSGGGRRNNPPGK
ncbi:Putative uncharacterized protein [Moritella viscosa]|nr:Putative uncharacterized protein [Moritella viscosa]